MFTIRFLPSGRSIDVSSPISVLEAARLARVQIESTCGGKQKCGKCKVVIRNSMPNILPPSAPEKNLLGPDLVAKGYRLACATMATDNLTVFVPRETRTKRQVILTSAQELPSAGSIKPPVLPCHVTVPSPTISDPTADRERLVKAMEMEHGFKVLYTDSLIVRKIPAVLRSTKGSVRILVRKGNEIVGIGHQSSNGPYGIAIDVGSTTVVAYLVDLAKTKILSIKSSMNPQIPYGDDVISRISFCQQTEEGLEKLHRSIISCTNSLISEACKDIGISKKEVVEVSVVGNTAMHHFFLGVNPQFVSLAPYAPAISSAQEYKARDLGLEIAPSGYVYFPPVKAGFVGSDAVACLLSTGMYRSRVPSLMIDIGTNGEIALGDRNSIVCCSTAAGPAFEGGHIKWGMRAASGAIERVRIDPHTLEVSLKTIHNNSPIGICGSGLISSVAELIRTGCILQSGHFNDIIKTPRLRKGEEGSEFVLSWKQENPTGHDIVITQKDIAELQMAKGAIRAGISILMESLGRRVRRIYLAGAGGNYIDPLDAQTVDLIPSPSNCQIIACGNAAGHGACLALVDMKKRRDAERIAGKMDYIELAASPRFQDLFVSHMFFPKAIDS